MRFATAVLALLLLLSGPILAGKAKRQALEACMPTVEFVNGPTTKDEWQCHYYTLATPTGWPKDLQGSPKELEAATRKKVCKKKGSIVLDWKTLCWVFLPVDQPMNVALVAVIIKWVDEPGDGGE